METHKKIEPMTVKELRTKKNLTARVIRDKELIKSFNPRVTKDGEVEQNQFYALASVEDPNGDLDGDIISVAGMSPAMDLEAGDYLPLLAAHKMSLPDGSPPQVGRIEALIKTKYKGMDAAVIRFSFALDADGTPLTPLTEQYYNMYKNDYASAFSVGCQATEDPVDLGPGKGYMFGKTQLHETSLVAIGANQHALGLTRSAKQEDELSTKLDALTKQMDIVTAALKAIDEKMGTVNATIDGSFIKAFAPLEERLDGMEASVTKLNQPKEQVVQKVQHEGASELYANLNKVLDKYK